MQNAECRPRLRVCFFEVTRAVSRWHPPNSFEKTDSLGAGPVDALQIGMNKDNASNIRERAFRFGCEMARLALSLAPVPGVRCLVDQLFKAGTAVGANLEEAKAGSSRREFARFIDIALREARESLYWLRICAAIEVGPPSKLIQLQGEADQLIRILTAIAVNTKRRMLLTGLVISAICIMNSALLMSI